LGRDPSQAKVEVPSGKREERGMREEVPFRPQDTFKRNKPKRAEEVVKVNPSDLANTGGKGKAKEAEAGERAKHLSPAVHFHIG